MSVLIVIYLVLGFIYYTFTFEDHYNWWDIHIVFTWGFIVLGILLFGLIAVMLYPLQKPILKLRHWYLKKRE